MYSLDEDEKNKQRYFLLGCLAHFNNFMELLLPQCFTDL